MRIDFIICGVQKGGTTALDAYLREHAQIQMGKVKEIHYFDNDDLEWRNPEYAPYHEQFDWRVTDVVRGEATPIYIYWPDSLERIRAYRPDIKLVLGLRHPTFRAYSHWKMEKGRNAEEMTFRECVTSGRARVVASPNGAHRVHSYVERGHYAQQIIRLRSLFPREQLFFYRTDDLWLWPNQLLGNIHSFLGVDPLPVAGKRYIVPVPATEAAPLDPNLRTFLDDTFRADIRAASQLTGLNLDDWLSAGYEEPMAAG